MLLLLDLAVRWRYPIGRIAQHRNLCCVGKSGTVKRQPPIALGQSACRAGHRLSFYTAQALVNPLQEAQKH